MDNTRDFENNQTATSVLKGEEFSINKILARESSVGHSSRIYYQNTTNEGMPFKWERQPGRPVNPPLAEVIPPPTPPPAVQSLALPLPLPKLVDDDPRDLFSWRFWSWKRIKNTFRPQKHDERRHCTRFNKHVTNYSDGDSDAEFVGWVHCDSRSSSFSSSSSLGSHNERFTRGLCSPWRT